MTRSKRKTKLKARGARPSSRREHLPAQPPVVPAPNDTVRREWLRRIEAEYRSGAHAHHLTHWLLQLGAPPDLVNMGLGVVSDELLHADLSTDVYQAAGGSEKPVLSPNSLVLVRNDAQPLEFDVLRVTVEMFCLGETVAVRLFSRLRNAELVPIVEDSLSQILKDEVKHREFGWALLEWLLQTPLADQFRNMLRQTLPAMVERVRRSYGGVALDTVGAERLKALEGGMAVDIRAWGLMPVSAYVEVVEQTIVKDYEPRFSRLQVPFELPATNP